MTDLLTAEQAAQRLGVTRHWLRMATKKGAVPHLRMSPRVVRYSVADLDAYLEAARRGAPAPEAAPTPRRRKAS
jgi:excisionase family DNA binding protein